MEKTLINRKIYANHLKNPQLLIGEHNEIFADFENHVITFKLTFQLHRVDITTKELQMHLIEPTVDAILKALFDGQKDQFKICKNAVEFSRLRQNPRKMFSCSVKLIRRIYIFQPNRNQDGLKVTNNLFFFFLIGYSRSTLERKKAILACRLQTDLYV